MIAESYFELRARLGAALFSLSKVAEESGIQPGRALLLRQMVGSLKDPFLFVVAGEVNAGKSSFLNALFGEDFCKADVLPTTESIVYFKHATEPRDVVIDDSFVEMYRNSPFLRDFHIVDTPGTNSVVEGHQEITERFIPMADLVIFVFSVSNPWGASTWEFIEQIYEGWLKNVVFVLQQSDLRSPEEVQAIVEHMRVTSRKRLRREFPVFPVSAKKAFVAKTSVHQHGDLLAQSGFPALEDYISGMVSSTRSVQQKFRNAIQTARAIMAEVEGQLHETRNLLDNDRQVLETLDAEITTHYAATSERLLPIKSALADGFRAAAERSIAAIEHGTGLAGVLFGGKSLVEETEKRLAEETARIGSEASTEGMREIERELPGLWERLDHVVKSEFRLAADHENASEAPRWLSAREGFSDELAEQCRGALIDSESVERLEQLVASHRTGTRGSVIGILLAAAAGGAGLATDLPALAIAGGAAALLAMLSLAVFRRNRRKKLREFLRDRFTLAGESLTRAIDAGFTSRLGKYYKEFLVVFEIVRAFCENQRAEYQPLLDDMQNLGTTFGEIETDLDQAETV
jgi:GTPase SAR1 family protein